MTGITDYGVFVGFYGGLKGLVHAKELDQKPQDCFETGQVQACWRSHLLLGNGSFY